jgi:hypothetical protein
VISYASHLVNSGNCIPAWPKDVLRRGYDDYVGDTLGG